VERDLLHRCLSFRKGHRHCTDAFGPESLFGGPRLGARVSHCEHHYSTPFLAWSKWYLCRILLRVLLTPKWLPDGPPCSSVSTSFILHRGSTIQTILDRRAADFRWRSSMPFLTATDFQYAQLLLHVGLRSAMSFYLGAVRTLLPPEWSICPGRSVGVFSAVVSQSAASTAVITSSCLMSARASTVWQWVHFSRHGRLESV
jgi:hypothetical protein